MLESGAHKSNHKKAGKVSMLLVALLACFSLVLGLPHKAMNPNLSGVRETSPVSVGIKTATVTSPQEVVFKYPKAGNWEQGLLDNMSLEAKIAQLLMIEVRPDKGAAHLQEVRNLVQNHQVGGLIFFKGSPIEQAHLTNELQSMSKVPLMVAIDGEWGLSMRLSETVEFPFQLALGAIQDKSLILEMGKEIGRQCRRLGIHVNFAPVADINNNPRNPVIGFRSFGERKEEVAERAWMYAQGMQEEKIIACAKHFPGHGDTEVDSHKDLPVILHNRKHLDSFELAPFRYLFNKGVMSVMTAHLHIPSIDTAQNRSVSVSALGIDSLLRKEMGYDGLSFTDALNMKGVSKFYPRGELELMALVAGNDILLGPEDVALAIGRIRAAVEDGTVPLSLIDSRVLRVLSAKKWCGLDNYAPIEIEGLLEDLNNPEAIALKKRLTAESMVLLGSKHPFFPIGTIEGKTALVALGSGAITPFQEGLLPYIKADVFALASNATSSEIVQLLSDIKGYEKVILSIHGLNKYSTRDYGLTTKTINLVETIQQYCETFLVFFGNPYGLEKLRLPKGVLLAWDDETSYQNKAAQAMAGVRDISGRLPVSAGPYKAGDGLNHHALNILKLSSPEESGFYAQRFKAIDSIMGRAMMLRATPGAQILVAHKGEIIFNKNYGFHTYDKNASSVMGHHLYDLASITKILSTTLAVMKLTEEGKMNPSDPLSQYLPELKGTKKEKITIAQVLNHKAGFTAWIPFYLDIIKDSNVYHRFFSFERNDSFTIEVGNNLYLKKNYEQQLIKTIIESPLKQTGTYLYSDLGMILLRFAVEKAAQMPLDQYVNEQFYKPMGLKRIGYHPLKRFQLNEIIPTEIGADFRKDLIQGYVHDPAAAMLGGVSGHAGLFANSFDVAALMYLLINKGLYNNKRYLKTETVVRFTRKQHSDSRRGLGFDKPEPNDKKISPVSELASLSSFGHSGFTGTLAWADPDHDLVYVFLSNRIHPTAENKLLIKESVRTAIMDVVCQTILQSESKKQ